MSNSFNSGTATQVQNFFSTLFNMLGVSTADLSQSASFRTLVETRDGSSVTYAVTPLDRGVSLTGEPILSSDLVVPTSGSADLDGAVGTATLVASTVTATVPTPTDGSAAVPVGSTVYATVETAAGKPKLLSAVRASDSTITISSTGSGYGALLESAGVTGTLVAGELDVTLTNAVGDRLCVALVTSHGTAGVLSVKRKSGSEVTVQSWLAATGIQVLDISDIIVYNFGQAAQETSTVRWAVIRP